MSALGPHLPLAPLLKAHAGGYGNNCAFHSMIHSWLNLPNDKIIALAESYKVYDDILETFNAYYGTTIASMPEFLACMRNSPFSHPYNREIILGSIFRIVARKITGSPLPDGHFIAQEAAGQFANAMGADFTVETGEAADRPVYEARIRSPLFNVRAYYGYDHYDFLLEDELATVQHNSCYGEPLPGTIEYMPIIDDFGFYNAANTVGVDNQAEAIKALVRSAALILQEDFSAKKKEASAAEDSLFNVASAAASQAMTYLFSSSKPKEIAPENLTWVFFSSKVRDMFAPLQYIADEELSGGGDKQFRDLILNYFNQPMEARIGNRAVPVFMDTLIDRLFSPPGIKLHNSELKEALDNMVKLYQECCLPEVSPAHKRQKIQGRK